MDRRVHVPGEGGKPPAGPRRVRCGKIGGFRGVFIAAAKVSRSGRLVPRIDDEPGVGATDRDAPQIRGRLRREPGSTS